VESLEDRTTPAYGLDPTFSGDGLLQTHLADSENRTATAVQPDGCILVEENTAGESIIARFNPDGTPDPTFGTDGQVTLPAGRQVRSSLAVGADGLIYATVAGPQDLGVVRLTADGRPDAAFGDSGVRTLPFDSFRGAVLTVQPDGKLVVFSTTSKVQSDVSSGREYAVARLLPTGEADPSFAGDGVLEFDAMAGDDSAADRPEGVALAPDGKLVVMMWADIPTSPQSDATLGREQLAVARITPAGSLDRSFGGDGMWLAGRDGAPNIDPGAAMAVQPDGKIVLAGQLSDLSTTPGPATSAVRLNADGSVDAGFDGGSPVEVLPGGGFDGNTSVGLLADGRVVVATTAFSSQTMSVAMLTSAGRLDPSFGGGSGLMAIDFPDRGARRYDGAEALAGGPDGRIVVVGKAYTSLGSVLPYAQNDLIVAVLSDPGAVRTIKPPFSPDPPLPVAPPPGTGATPHPGAGLDPTFGSGGHVTLPGEIYYNALVAGTAPDGRIIIATQEYVDGARFIVDRLTPDGALDPTFGTGGTATVDLTALGYWPPRSPPLSGGPTARCCSCSGRPASTRRRRGSTGPTSRSSD
jgi:uncharacterized delta-60 repeat protein